MIKNNDYYFIACPFPPISSDTTFEPIFPAAGIDFFPVGILPSDGPDSIMYFCVAGSPTPGLIRINTCILQPDGLSGDWSLSSPITCQPEGNYSKFPCDLFQSSIFTHAECCYIYIWA